MTEYKIIHFAIIVYYVLQVGPESKAITPMRPGYSTPQGARPKDVKTPATRATPLAQKTPARSPGKMSSPAKVSKIVINHVCYKCIFISLKTMIVND